MSHDCSSSYNHMFRVVGSSSVACSVVHTHAVLRVVRSEPANPSNDVG